MKKALTSLVYLLLSIFVLFLMFLISGFSFAQFVCLLQALLFSFLFIVAGTLFIYAIANFI